MRQARLIASGVGGISVLGLGDVAVVIGDHTRVASVHGPKLLLVHRLALTEPDQVWRTTEVICKCEYLAPPPPSMSGRCWW